MKDLSYQDVTRSMTLVGSRVNNYGQIINFYEYGDDMPLVAVFPDSHEAFGTDFYDLDDFYAGSEYMPVLLDTAYYAYQITEIIDEIKKELDGLYDFRGRGWLAAYKSRLSEEFGNIECRILFS